VPLPIVYNLRSVKERWTSSLVAIIGIAGTVSVFIAMLALARGFGRHRCRRASRRTPSCSRRARLEMTSAIELDAVRMVEDQPQVARRGRTRWSRPGRRHRGRALRGTNADANVQMRGVSPKVLGSETVKVTSGRFFTPGLYEIVVGKHAVLAYEGLDLGRSIRIGPGTWKVVGVFDAGGSAFDSEIWADSDVLNGNYQRPNSVFQSVTVKLRSEADFAAFDAALHKNPHLQVQAVREPQYYEGQSRTVTTLITVLGGMVALVMGLGAILASLNTMYSAVAERSREIAVLRALGFGSMAIVISFLSEALWIALIGGVIGCIAVLPVNGINTER
jgi:putative ABC transport system permease protein